MVSGRKSDELRTRRVLVGEELNFTDKGNSAAEGRTGIASHQSYC